MYTYFCRKYPLGIRYELLCAEILKQVVDIAKHNVHSGRWTERKLARTAGISQPHLHNALKGVRQLSPESADKLLVALGLTVPDILWWSPGEAEPGTRSIPLLRDRIGPGSHADFARYRGYLGLPRGIAARLTEPVAARLAPDPAMPLVFRDNDLVVLDRNVSHLLNPPDGWSWVIADTGGFRVRYLKQSSAGLMSAAEPMSGGELEWKRLGTGPQNLRELVKAQIVWNGRELEATAPRSARPPGRRD